MYIVAEKNNRKESIKNISVLRVKNITQQNAEEFLTLELDFLVNKKNYILNEIDKVELYITPTPESTLNSRISLADASKKDTTSAAIDGELKRAQSLKELESDLNIKKISDIDLSNIIDNSIASKVKNFKISDIDAFGEKQVYRITNEKQKFKTIPDNEKNRKNTNYFEYFKNTFSTNSNKVRLEQRLKNLNQLGIDIVAENKSSGFKKYISNKKFEEKAGLDKIKGRFSRIQNNSNSSNLIKNFIQIVEFDHNKTSKDFYQSANSDQNNQSLVAIFEPNVEENLKFDIKINSNLISTFPEVTLFAILYKNNIKKEIKFSTLNVSNLLYDYYFPELNFEFSVLKEKKNNFAAKIFNNENSRQDYTIFSIEKNVFGNKTEKVTDISILPKTGKTISFKKSQYKNYRFVANCVYDGKIINNSKISFYHGSNQAKNSRFVKFYCTNNTRGLEITIDDVSDYNQIEILRRDLTKKQRSFTVITKDNVSQVENFSFLDDQVEDKDVYEYKIKYKNSAGLEIISRNSFIEKFCKKKSIVSVTANLEIRNFTNINSYTINATFGRNINNADKLVNSLLGNYYSLFEEKLRTINQENQVVYDSVLTALNLDTGEQREITSLAVNERGDATITFELPKADYIFKISPRILLPNDLISIIANSSLENFDAFLNQETGDILYLPARQSVSTSYAIGSKKIKILKSLSSNKKVLASFYIDDPKEEIDYFIFSYSINNDRINFYDVAICTVDNQNYKKIKEVNFLYNIPDFIGTAIFIAQPVTTSGEILNSFIIGNITEEQ